MRGPRRRIAWVFWGLFISWFSLLYFLSSNPSPKVPGSEFQHIDKVYHAGYFFVGGWLFLSGLYFSIDASFGRLAWFTLLAIALVGIFDEVHQSYTPSRQGGDKGDWMADFTGGILAVLACRVLLALHQKRLGTLPAPLTSDRA